METNPPIELIFVVEQAPEGGYTARALGASIFTEADSLEELRQNVREATECHFDEGQQPKIIRYLHP
jgi:predicted RNase H-like HicB family nuclease